jgi:hypothetical protein
MPVRVRITFLDPEQSSVHRIRNFGEDLWRVLHENKRVEIDIGEIDRAIDEITYTVRGKFLRRTLAEVRHRLKLHFMEDEAVISTEEA